MYFLFFFFTFGYLIRAITNFYEWSYDTNTMFKWYEREVIGVIILLCIYFFGEMVPLCLVMYLHYLTFLEIKGKFQYEEI